MIAKNGKKVYVLPQKVAVTEGVIREISHKGHGVREEHQESFKGVLSVILS